MARMIVLDASVMIALLDDQDPHSPRARGLLAHVSDERVVAHRLTLAETLMHAAREGRAVEAADTLDRVGIGRIDQPDDPLQLAQLRARTRLPMPDCVVLLAAVRDGSRLATFDERLAAAALAEGVPVDH